uniref:Disco interacting C n=1 Tax=Neolamprologus brichardi TaxID=32507 RepID=A0A3Q4N4K0_NEOBR
KTSSPTRPAPNPVRNHRASWELLSEGTNRDFLYVLHTFPDVHTEAVQAALAKHKERKMAVPMPSKRRSLVVQSSMDAYTPPGKGHTKHTSSGSEEEDGGGGGGTSSSQEGSISMEHWISRAIHGTSSTTTTTSSTASSLPLPSCSSHAGLLSHLSLRRRRAVPAGMIENGNSGPRRSGKFQSEHGWWRAQNEENHSAPPDVTGYTNNTANTTANDAIQVERAPGAGTAAQRQTPKYGNAELMETGDGVPVSSRVSAKIQQLVNTLKRPKRPPLREFFVDDFEELLEVQQPDPNQPKAEGAQMVPMGGEQLGVVTNWPPSLEAALQRWGTISPKAPCLTTMDTNGKPLYVLTYGKLWSRSVKVAYNLLHKLGTKQEPLVRPGDRVALVFPNNDPASFMTAFYGCLLAEVVPVPIEVPLTRKDAGSQQIGFLLGSCGVTVALTSDACHKGLPKSPTGEIPQFKGQSLCLFELKHLQRRLRDEYKTCKDGSVLGVTVMRIAMLTHCQAITQSCSYTEAETIVNVLDFKKDVGLWHAIQTSVMNMMHVISIPYALMKVNPLSWIQKVCQYKAKVACVKSRDMHWALVAHRDQRDVNLSSLRMLVVADGSNPWSISSCDAFLNVFQTKGLKPEVICPCASSPEALTVAIRRPLEEGTTPPGRGILSMQGLSHGVIRVDSEEKLSVLTLQDVGSVMPGGETDVQQAEFEPSTAEVVILFFNVYIYNLRLSAKLSSRLPAPPPEIGPASVMVGNLVSGKRIAQASGRDLGQIEDNDQARKVCVRGGSAGFLVSPHTSSLTCVQLHKRAEKIAAMLAERGHLQDGDHVALVYPPGIDLIVAFYGCLYAGCVPITVRPPHPQNIATTLPTVKMIVEVSRSVCVMTTQVITKLLRSKEASAAVDVRTWPPVMDTGIKPPTFLPKTKPPLLTFTQLHMVRSCLCFFSMSHTATSAFCRSIKLQCELYPSREVAICLDPYCGLGFVLWCLCSVYSGHQSILIPPSELEVNPALWLSAVSQYKVRDTFCSYSVMELCTKGLGLQTDSLKARGLDLSRVRTCVVVAEERPRIALTQSFSKLFKDLGLHPRAVSTSFGCRVNLAICLQVCPTSCFCFAFEHFLVSRLRTYHSAITHKFVN